jgi:hypothetical protein
MKGVFQTKPHFDSIREVFERVQSDEKKDFQIAVLYEYLTLTQINSIPNGATPFRSPGYNVLSFARWPHDTPENLKYARELVGELTSIVLKGRAQLPGSENSGYGNYGQFLSIVQTPHRWCSSVNATDIDSGVAPVETGEVASKSKAEGLYGDNYPRMQQIKKIYDPELLFNKWFPITPPA